MAISQKMARSQEVMKKDSTLIRLHRPMKKNFQADVDNPVLNTQDGTGNNKIPRSHEVSEH